MTEEWIAIYGPYRNLDEAWLAHQNAPDDDQPDLKPAASSDPIGTEDTAAEVINAGLCDGNCMTASGPLRECTCRCAGNYHGVLAHAVVHAHDVGRYLVLTRASDIQSRAS
jgi:hypothetical protein